MRIMIDTEINKRERPADNGRFCEMAALAPQKRQCELGSYYPARTFVKPPPRKAAGALCASRNSLKEKSVERK